MEDFNIILEIMNKKGVSQKQLADCLGVSEQKVSDWKAKRIRSWVKRIDKIAACLGVSVAECLGITQKEKPADRISGLKEKLLEVMMDLDELSLRRLLEHAELLEAAKRNTKER